MSGIFVLPTKVKLNDANVSLPIDIGQDISAYDTVELILRTPLDNVTTKIVLCSKDPNNVCQLILPIISTTFDVTGAWLAQPRLSLGTEIIHGKQFEIEVVENLT